MSTVFNGLTFSALMRTYKLEKSFPTNISSEYLNDSGSKWGTWEMFRESVQNMMDEAELMADTNGGDLLDFCKIGHAGTGDTYLELRDKGRGVDWPQIFLIGQSGKRGTHYKGQKGEGEALSFLVAARAGIDKLMLSQDWAVKARLDSYNGTAHQVLVFDLYRTDKPIEGTVWRYSITPEISKLYQDLPSYFPQLSRREQRRQEAQARRDNDRQLQQQRKSIQNHKRAIKQRSINSNRMIITPKKGQVPRLYVRGVYVKEIFSLFSYNLQKVDINRDRSMVDEMKILDEIQAAFNSDDLTTQQAKTYWEMARDGSKGDAGLLEYRTLINITTSANFVMMRNAFFKTHGKKACIFTNRVASMDAEGMGFKVIDLHPHAKDTAMGLGIITDMQVLGAEGDVIPVKKPTAKMNHMIDVLHKIGKAFGFKYYPITPVEKILGINDDNLGGYYQAGKIYIMKSWFEGSRRNLLRAYIHEAGHGESGEPDATRAFTSFFENLMIDVMLGKYADARPLINELIGI